MSRVRFAVLTVSLGFAGATWVADLPTKAPPYDQPAAIQAPKWTGFYVGGSVGALWMSQDGAWNPLPSPAAFGAFPVTGELASNHFVGGIHGGDNWQMSPRWVYSWTGASAGMQGVWNFFPQSGPVPNSLSSLSSKLDSLSSVRGRVGFLVTPNALVYATGRIGWGDFDYQASAFNGAPDYVVSTSFSNNPLGFVGRGGLEWAVTQNWLVRAEYLYYGLGDASTTAGAPTNPSFPSGFD